MSGVILPVVVVTPNEDGDVIHEVKAGQSLWQIAISYETRIDEIKRLNNLFDNNIYPGSKLLIRKGVPTATAASVITQSQAVPAPTLPPTIVSIAATPTKTVMSVTPVTNSSRNTLGIVIGIFVLAILGGSVIAWWGTKKKE